MLSRRCFLGGASLLTLGLPWRGAAQPVAGASLSLQGTAVQAFPLFASLTSPTALEQVRFDIEGKSYGAAPSDSGRRWRAVLPLSIDCPSQVKLRVHSGRALLWERAVGVKSRDYGMQYLSLDPQTLAGYDDPQNKADDQAILNSMLELDPQQRWQGNFSYPCQAPETTGFGQRRLYNGWKKGWHKGLDLGGWEGQSVTAPANGRVVHRARGIVNGNTLVLSHGLGLFSVYFHLNDWNVEVGQEVGAGDLIATVGGTGGFAPHLHWEMRAFGSPVHPKAFFQLPAAWQSP